MKKIYIFLIVFILIFVISCQPQAETARQMVYEIYLEHTSIIKEDILIEDDIFYGGFSSFTKASEDGFELFLLKDDVYSELLFEWEVFTSEEVIINKIKINYFDFEKDIHFSVSSEKDGGLLYQGFNYDDLVVGFSKIRIDDLQWLLLKLGYEIE